MSFKDKYGLIIQERWYRRRFENTLMDIEIHSVPIIQGHLLLDASFDNPNYWLRAMVFIAALGIPHQNLTGLLGVARRTQQKRTLRRFGINSILDMTPKIDWDRKDSKVTEYLTKIKSRNDILCESLPYDVPPKLLYDYVLKKQQKAYVQLDDPEMMRHVGTFFGVIERTAEIVELTRPELVIASHAVGLTSPLVWISLLYGIPVLCPFGLDGVSRYWKLNNPNDIYDFQDRLTHKEFFDNYNSKREKWIDLGRAALRKRFKGLSLGLGVREAYTKRTDHVDKQLICRTFSWNTAKPVIGVFASNWYDYPHTYGMNNFVDFYDWISSILRRVSKVNHCHWLFKAHPCDDLYGGLTLDDFFDFSASENIGLVPTGWSSQKLLESLDGVVTYHGTVGLEASCLGKPVLVSDTGWYTHIGFVKRPKNREHFLQLLGQEWWADMNMDENTEAALGFAGTYWSRPDWQRRYVLDDDSDKWSIYRTAPPLLDSCRKEISIESNLIREWFASNSSHYHSYKTLTANSHIV